MIAPTPAALRIARRTAGLTQTQLGKRMGISGAHLCNLERRKAGATAEMRTRWLSALGYPTKSVPTISTTKTKKGVRITILVNTL